MIDYYTYFAGRNGNFVVMEILGHADDTTSEFLLDCIERLIENGARHIILDCSGLDFITSMGLGAVVRLNQKLNQRKGSLGLVSVPEPVSEVIRFSRLNRLLHLYGSVDDAVESVEQSCGLLAAV